jgi:hypothetical protein
VIAPKKPEKGKMKIERGLELRITSKIKEHTCILRRYLSLERRSLVLFKCTVGGTNLRK